MKIKTLITTWLCLLCFCTFAQKAVWKVDPSHSSVKFNVTHLVVSKVTGEFTEFEGSLTGGEGDDFSNATVEALIKVKSIDTEDLMRDKHLKDEDFFYAEEYPEMKFKSKSFKRAEGNTYLVEGDLTIRDVTKPVELTAEYGGKITAFNKTIAGFSLKGNINRFDFGLKWDNTLDSGSLIVGEEVELELNIELIKQ